MIRMDHRILDHIHCYIDNIQQQLNLKLQKKKNLLFDV